MDRTGVAGRSRLEIERLGLCCVALNARALLIKVGEPVLGRYHAGVGGALIPFDGFRPIFPDTPPFREAGAYFLEGERVAALGRGYERGRSEALRQNDLAHLGRLSG